MFICEHLDVLNQSKFPFYLRLFIDFICGTSAVRPEETYQYMLVCYLLGSFKCFQYWIFAVYSGNYLELIGDIFQQSNIQTDMK